MGDQERGAGRPNPQPLSTPAEVCLGAKSQASGHKFVLSVFRMRLQSEPHAKLWVMTVMAPLPAGTRACLL